MYQIRVKRCLTPVTVLFEIEAPLVAKEAAPGQFVIVRLSEKGERIPLTIAGADSERGTVTIVVQRVGRTSSELCSLAEGQEILDFAGPLGQAAPLLDSGRVMMVGGGFGAAPILPIAKLLHERGLEVTTVVGARNESLLILEEELARVSDRVMTATDDGSKGKKGLVTSVMQDLFDSEPLPDAIYAIGPMVMMRAVAEFTRPYGVKTYVSVDPIMVDGTGMCGGCRVTVGGKVYFACVDGPIFDGHEVDFNEAVRRGRMYRDEQQVAAAHGEGCGGCQ